MNHPRTLGLLRLTFGRDLDNLIDEYFRGGKHELADQWWAKNPFASKEALDMFEACCDGIFEAIGHWPRYSTAQLHAACDCGYVEIAEHIIDRVDTLNRYKMIIVSKCGHVELARKLLDAGGPVNFCLGQACRRGHIEMARLALMYKPSNVERCIITARSFGHPALADLLRLYLASCS